MTALINRVIEADVSLTALTTTIMQNVAEVAKVLFIKLLLTKAWGNFDLNGVAM